MAEEAAGEQLRDRVQQVLAGFLDRQHQRLSEMAPGLGDVATAASSFLLAGGKRLRPAFCYWGWRAAGGSDDDRIVTAAASLELLHACALVHDDLMDDSDTRRGQEAVHRRFARRHADGGWRGDAASFGSSAALLLGDLCLIWADELLRLAGFGAETLQRAAPVYDEMRVELMAGQYLDLLEQVSGAATVEGALRVARYKSAKYTVERPLHLGALLADAPEAVLATCSRYGLPLGEAFQLRDDVLGVFGDPASTGKPAGDDLREGKRTVLVAAALEHATPAQAVLVRQLLGDPALDEDGVAALREVIRDTGALKRVEQLIDERTDAALAALAEPTITDAARAALRTLAVAATVRSG